ncbi:unnamed protein product [Rotaria socialis]|uniref:Replication-associated protein n=1 Tax=Rotaria socialis TaxID=392032 RepID=A0A817RCJ3_9BILA|nr:unnamed protein product [Rotaria socialis]CAF3555185.1 unnamed protein product [Rotaria socialis]CAF3612209.1 unnamed protein product [Rotaria socialis]CAF4394479.1 unnamed protein product [Rotaria socialis]CAF4434718.1 unnamed protein product [Rotaria socialis]
MSGRPRPGALNLSAEASSNHRTWSIDSMLSSSPPSSEAERSRIFRRGTIISPNTYDRSILEVDRSDLVVAKEAFIEEDMEYEGTKDNAMSSIDNQQILCNIINRSRQEELDRLSQVILSQRAPYDSDVQLILSQWNFGRSSLHTNELHPSSILIQSGVVASRHRPSTAYSHLDRASIARECQFNLELAPSTTTATHKRIRLHAKSFAITAWTDVSKDVVLDHIKREFRIENIQYICVSEEISELNHRRHLHVQIILKEKVDRRAPFLDRITGTRCNYQVTRNDLAWNEYIKKEGNYLEFNEFKSTRARADKQYPSLLASSSSSSSVEVASSSQSNTSDSTHVSHQQVPTHTNRRTTTATTTVRAQLEVRRQLEKDTIVRALQLAEINVHQAMDLIRQALPCKFFAHSSWYLSTFNYIHVRAQEHAERHGQIDKEYVWPLSFPNCTDRLREAMDRWIRHHFSRTKRAKCLILIGPTGTGKTSFAMSLPGRVNYFKERWNLDHWSDYARHSVYDDIPWDDFAKLNYPNKKSLLTQNGKMNATDKYRNTREINVQQPAIVLLNPEDAGSLLAQPTTIQEQQAALYWKERAFIYVMQQDEYFYKRSQPHHQAVTADDDAYLSGSSSMGSNDARLGEKNEFEYMIHRYQESHRKPS